MGFLGEPVDIGEGFDGFVLFFILLAGHHLGDAYDYPRRIKVVVEGFALSQELGGEEEIEMLECLVA